MYVSRQRAQNSVPKTAFDLFKGHTNSEKFYQFYVPLNFTPWTSYYIAVFFIYEKNDIHQLEITFQNLLIQFEKVEIGTIFFPYNDFVSK